MITHMGQNSPLAPIASHTATDISQAPLLHQPAAQVRLALGECLRQHRGSHRQISLDSVEIRLGARAVRRAETLLELLGGEPTGDHVLAQLADHTLAVGVGNTQR